MSVFQIQSYLALTKTKKTKLNILKHEYLHYQINQTKPKNKWGVFNILFFHISFSFYLFNTYNDICSFIPCNVISPSQYHYLSHYTSTLHIDL